jgi:hypothetical protein
VGPEARPLGQARFRVGLGRKAFLRTHPTRVGTSCPCKVEGLNASPPRRDLRRGQAKAPAPGGSFPAEYEGKAAHATAGVT